MKMLLIDGNSMLFRAYYATCYGNMMKTTNGIYTNAVFGFANMINKAIDTIHPEYLVVAFDKGKHTFRHDLSSDYKGGRKQTPQELVPQFKLVRDYLDAYHITYLEYDNIEADDIIGTLANKYQDVEIDILTSDRDMLQLIDNTTSVYLMKKGLSDLVKMDEGTLSKEWNLRPDQIVDLKGLMGDSSDNIKGVSKVGEKTAIKLLNEYDSIDGIYQNIEYIKGKLKENLINDKEIAYLSKTLATIKKDVTINHKLEDFSISLDIEGVNKFYQTYEMKSLLRHKPTAKNFKRLPKVSDDLLREGCFIFFDCENDNYTYYEAKVHGLALVYLDKAAYIPLEDAIKDQSLIDFLKSDTKKYTYDLKHYRHLLKKYNLTLNGFDDIMLMAYLFDNNLDTLTKILDSFSKITYIEEKDVYGTLKKPKLIDTIAQSERAINIAGALSEMVPELKKALVEKEMSNLYTLERELNDVLFDMENEGIVCKTEIIDEIGEQTKIKLDETSKAIYELADCDFNIQSPKQLAEVLFDKLNLPANKKRSTSAEALESLVDVHPIVKEILKYRKLSKLYSSYVEGLKKFIGNDGKIHTVFSQTITSTGRLSSFDPNLQNISIKDEDGRSIRKAFMASDKNHILISSDYSQIELRMLAHLANEPKMIEAFNSHIDIHTKTAMDIFNLKEEEVNPLIRRQAKAINFGVVYGISEFGLSKQADISIIKAREYIKNYFLTYPSIKSFLDNTIEECKRNGYVKTILSRRRYINEINSNNYMLKEFAKRASMNSVVQGSAADLIKIAMINIAKRIKKEGLQSKMILQIHDELIFDVLNEEKDIMINLISEEMKGAMDLRVVLDFSLSYAYTWYDAK